MQLITMLHDYIIALQIAVILLMCAWLCVYRRKYSKKRGSINTSYVIVDIKPRNNSFDYPPFKIIRVVKCGMVIETISKYNDEIIYTDEDCQAAIKLHKDMVNGANSLQ